MGGGGVPLLPLYPLLSHIIAIQVNVVFSHPKNKTNNNNNNNNNNKLGKILR